jgi:hypothetical protein
VTASHVRGHKNNHENYLQGSLVDIVLGLILSTIWWMVEHGEPSDGALL